MMQTHGLRAGETVEVLGDRMRVINALDATLRASRPPSLDAVSAGLIGCAHRVAVLLKAELLWPDTGCPASVVDTACLSFSEQWVIDVASMPEAMVAELRGHLGDDALMDFVHSLLVQEQRIRLDLAWQRLGLLPLSGDDHEMPALLLDELPEPEPQPVPARSNRNGDPALNAAMAEWQAAVVCLDQVDPITTELVRLRCANYHDCHT